MPVAQNILRLSGTLYWTLSVLVFALPALVLAALVRDVLNPAGLTARFPEVTVSTPPDAAIALLAGLAGLLPLGAMIYALWQMRSLFDLYRRGEIFSLSCAGHLQRIGQGLFALAALGIVARTLQILALTWANPEGQRALAIGLGGDQLGFLLSGAFVLVIGRVMREAARVAEENAGFV